MRQISRVQLFEQTMLPHLDAAYNLARWLTRDAQDADDLVQEAYLRALRFFDSFQGGDGKAWLLQVVRNSFLSSVSRKKNATTVPFNETIHSAPEPANQESALVQAAGRSELRQCMEALPAEFREVIVMRELEEMPYKEIAYAASLPIGTVMSRLARARQRLQQCMASRQKGGNR